MSNSEYAIHIQLDKLLNQLNVNNFFRIMKLIRDPCIDINDKIQIKNITDDFHHIIDGALYKNSGEKNLMRLEALLSDDETMYVKLLIKKVNNVFSSDELSIDDMRSIYIFIKDDNIPDAYMLANDLGLDGLTYNVVRLTKKNDE